jgi:FkbM family methyltransferase
MPTVLNPLWQFLHLAGRRLFAPHRDRTGEPGAFHFRPGTMDRSIYHEVVVENVYRLPPAFRRTDVILDVGCHIGSFAAACLSRGAGRVVSYEVEPSNFELARRNLAPFGRRADVRRAAVWRSDVPVDSLFFARSSDPINTGGGAVGADSGERVPAVPFGRVLAELTAGGRRIRLLKLDCEGSEFPILLTAPPLDAVDEVSGEYHLCETTLSEYRLIGRGRYHTADIRDRLERNGFRVEFHVNPRNPAIGEFFARRPSV